MANARNEAARRRYYIAYLNAARRAEPRDPRRNRRAPAGARRPLRAPELRPLRHAPAHGWPARTPWTPFLADVRAAVAAVEERETSRNCARMKAEMTGTPLDATQLHALGRAFYSERVRARRYDVDQEALRAYFPMPQALDWLLAVSSRLYGVSFEEVKVPVWHEDVRYYDVLDAKTARSSRRHLPAISSRARASSTTRRRGRCAARAGASAARRHGAGDQLRPRRARPTRARDVLPRVRPRAARRAVGDRLHRARRHQRRSATSSRRRRRCSRSGRAASSRSRSSSEVCPACPHADAAADRAARAARRFGQGIQYARQWLYAVFDMALYDRAAAAARRVEAAWRRHAARLRRRARSSRLRSPHRRAAMPPATTATCGRR